MSNMIGRRGFALSLLSTAALPCASWAQASGAIPGQLAAALEIGVLPNISARLLMTQYQVMREYLGRELRRPVQVSTAPSWVAFHQRTLALDYDIIVTASHLARLAQLDRGYVPLLQYAPDIKGLIAFAKSRPIQGIAELKGQTLVLSNPQSLVALRGLQWLADNGLQRDRDYKAINTPTDDSVGNVIVRGDAIAAMLSGGEYRAIPDALKAQIQLLTTFAEVPGFVVMASPKLRPADAQAIKDQLLMFATRADEGKTFFAATGFAGIGELKPGLMDAMDAYVAATRKVLAPA